MRRATNGLITTLLFLGVVTLAGVAEAQVQQRRQAGAARYRVGLMFQPGSGTDKPGLVLSGVVPGGAADKAGLRAGDVITHINGREPANDPGEFAPLFGAPDPINLQVRRGSETLTLTVVPERAETNLNVTARGPSRTREAKDGELRIPMDISRGKPSVLARINGKGPWPFLVDSGAGITVINRELVEELNLPVTGTRRIGDPSNPEAIEADTLRVESIKIGEAEFSDIEVVSWDRSSLYPAGERPQGVLGIGLFADFLFTFDYPAGEIGLVKGELPEPGANGVVPYTDNYGGIPEIEILLAGETVSAHFDTGSPAAISVPDSWEKRLKLHSAPVVMGRARTVNSDFEIRSGKLVGDVDIAGNVFKDPEIVFAGVLENANAANIGSRLLGDFALTFDQKNRRVRLQRP